MKVGEGAFSTESFDKESGEYTVEYDDGDAFVHDLKQCKWSFAPDQPTAKDSPKRAAAAEAGVGGAAAAAGGEAASMTRRISDSSSRRNASAPCSNSSAASGGAPSA